MAFSPLKGAIPGGTGHSRRCKGLAGEGGEPGHGSDETLAA